MITVHRPAVSAPRRRRVSLLAAVGALALAGCVANLPAHLPAPGTLLRDCVDCPEMVVVPAGSFLMGSPASEAGRLGNQGPQHPVRISRPFAIGRFEVTRGQYGRFVRDTGYASSNRCVVWTGVRGGEAVAGRSWQDPAFAQTDRHPVVCISWNDANAYVRWLSSRTGKPYRLLSEAEWEYAARAGTDTRYSFGDDATQLCRYANVPDLTAQESVQGAAWKYTGCRDGYGVQTAPAGSFAANAFGLHDMHGNVWEWTQDCYHDDFTGAPSDGSAWMAGPCGARVVRGGSLSAPIEHSRSASRYKGVSELRGDAQREDSAVFHNFNLGLRVGRSLE